MRENILFQKIRDDKPVFGLANCYFSPGILEAMCPGWDFVWIDGQHGHFDFHDFGNTIRTADSIGVDSLLRVPGHEQSIMCPLMDLDPSAVMVPLVDTPEQAVAISNHLHFPPRGTRSYGGRRIAERSGSQYHKDRELLVVAQIETPEAVANAEAIANVDGIDLLFLGADDLRLQSGLEVDTPLLGNDQLRHAFEHTAKAARAAGKACGLVGIDPKVVKAALDIGYRMFSGGSDMYFLKISAAAALGRMRALAGD